MSGRFAIKTKPDFSGVKKKITDVFSKPALPSNIVPGIDVSHYQAGLDWKAAWALGYRFAIAKAGDGQFGNEATFLEHRSGAKDAGFIFGSYYFFRFDIDPINQATAFLKATHGVLPGELPLTCDVEWDSHSAKYKDGQSMDEAAANNVGIFVNKLAEETGINPILYTNYYFFNPGTKWKFEQFPLWISAYHTTIDKVKIPKPWTSATIWQDADNVSIGKVTRVDSNKFLGTIDQLKAMVKA